MDDWKALILSARDIRKKQEKLEAIEAHKGKKRFAALHADLCYTLVVGHETLAWRGNDEGEIIAHGRKTDDQQVVKDYLVSPDYAAVVAFMAEQGFKLTAKASEYEGQGELLGYLTFA
jgi:acyl transferase domain-containing protein